MKSIYILLFVLFATTLAFSQSNSNYEVKWNKVSTAAQYRVFLWQGSNQAACPFVDGQDYLSPNISSYQVALQSDTSIVLVLPNNGQYVRAGVVAVNVSGFYSDLGVSPFVTKGVAPTKPTNITIIKQ